MRVSFSRLMVAAPAALLILVGVASVAFSLGASSGSAPNARAPQSTSAPAHPGSTNAPVQPGASGAPGNPRLGAIAPGLVFGTVASKATTSIAVTTSAGKTVTVNVTSTTKYVVGVATNATLADIAVGSRISVQGTTNADGSIDATVVRAIGTGGRGFRGGTGGGTGGRKGFPTPNPSAAPSGASI